MQIFKNLFPPYEDLQIPSMLLTSHIFPPTPPAWSLQHKREGLSLLISETDYHLWRGGGGCEPLDRITSVIHQPQLIITVTVLSRKICEHFLSFLVRNILNPLI